MEILTEKGQRVFREARRSRGIAAELYRLRCEALADNQIKKLEAGQPQQPVVLQGVTELEVLTIESVLMHYEKLATRVALDKAMSVALKVANDKEHMINGAENPVALKIHEQINDMILKLRRDEESDEEDDEEDDEEPKVEYAVAAEPPAGEPNAGTARPEEPKP